MIVRILIFLFLFSISTYAQQNVSQLYTKHKEQCDSLMRSYYGDYLFENYFRFDSTSSLEYHNQLSFGNDTVIVDSHYTYTMRYMFLVPGTEYDPGNTYVLSNDPGSIQWWETYPKPYFGRCAILGSSRLDSLSQKELGHPIEECIVRLVDLSSVDKSLQPNIDSSRVYLEVAYQTSRRYWKSKYITKIRTQIILIDGCTGTVVGRRIEHSSRHVRF